MTGTNDAPTAIDLTANSINENDGGAVIGTLSTTDIDTSDTHTYTVSDDRFEAVDDGTGTMVLKLKDGQSLDHESEPTVTLTVTADDGHGGTFDQDITINVADVNEAVTANDGAETTSENVSLDGMVTASDLDGDAISYSLDGQPTEGTVTLNADGSYSFAPGTDFDDLAVGESRTVSFDFTADDGKGSTDTGTVTIEVTGTNDAPTAIDLTANSINENDGGAVIGTLSTTDIDTSDTHTYTVSDDRFEAVDDGTGTMVLKLKDGQSLDHESEPTVTLTVTADDGHGGTFDQDITINVADVNEAVTANDGAETTSENVSLDGTVTASDLDGDAISYSLDGQPAQGTVTLNADGSYSFAPGTDFDDLAVGESRTVSFDFTADDGKGSTDTGTVTIEVTGTNDAPTAIDLTANSINENDSGAVIGTLSTTDIDTSDTHTYTVSDDRFEAVDDGTGTMVLKLKDGQSLDHESEPTVTLTVTADDGHGGTFDQDITINVADVNEAVTANDGAETTSENVSLDGTVTASDLDGDAISYSLDGQPTEGTVTLNADGSYSFAPGTDFDDLAVGESRTVSFDFTADDGKGSTDTGTVTIEVTGTNDAPTAIDLTANSINENDGGAVIGTLSTTDIDTSDTHTYTVSDDRFEAVDDGTGTMVLKLKDGQSLDHESEPTVTLTVTADDGHGGTFDQDITINVADVNEAVTANDGAETTSENVSLDGMVTASDLDGDAISYSLDGQPTEGTVTLNADGSYSFAPGTDFDDLAVGESRTVSFDFTADDGKGSTDTGTVTIEVTGTNDAPTAIDLTANSINENDGGAVIGTLSTTDIDTSDTHTYTVSDDRFEAVDDGTGTMVLKLKDGQSLDHESEPTVTLTVTADDGHGGTFDQDITINVADVNEAVTANDGAETTSENVSLDGMVTASDLDGDAISYSLDGQPAQGTVTLNADGSYSFAPGTDFDDLAVGESRTVSFDFTADDGKGSTDTGTVTIEVTGTNDAPTAIDLTANSINENDGGAVIGTLSTTDIDTSDTHTYTVSDDRFEAVDDGTGTMVLKLKDGQSLDHESEPTVTLTVTADDGHGGTFDQDITINVADVNEAVTANDGAETTSENVSLDGTVTASDLDGDAISYSLDGQPTEGTVTLNADGSYSFAPGTDFDDLAVGESRTVSFDFTADDGKGSTDTGTVTIEVTGTNDAPTAIDLTANSINENDGGAVIGTLSTTDIDTSDTHTYSVSDDRFEAVDDGTGTMVLKLKDGQSLDHESEPTVTLTVTADDGHGGTFDQDITINVADVNEAVTANDGAETTSENVSLDGTVTASDLDGDAISYSLDGQPTEGTVTLNADGSYSFAPGTDFDDLAVGESRTVSFDFTADDGKGSTDTGTVTIEVTGTNDAPTAIDLTANSINENDGGAVIGTLSTTDIDTSDTHTYTVSDDRFEAVDDGTGTMVLKLKDGQSLDHESEPTVTLTVTADDGHGGTFDQDFTINVTDVNEAPTLTAEGSYNFLYNGSFEVFNGGTHGGGDGTGWFEGAYIDGWTQTNIDIHEAGHNGLGATDGDYHVDLAGQTNGSLSRDMQGMEDGDTYSLSMDLKSRGTDGTGTGDATAAAGQSVVEIVWNGEVIATVDPSTDGLGWHTYTFDIVGGSGDGSNVITFNEVGSDNSFGTILDNFQITDSNGFGVLENQAGAQIATLGVIDEDVGDSHSYSASDSRFEVVDDGNGTMVLKLKDGVSLDHESEPTVDVTVTVTDSAGNTDSQVLNVTVGDINEAPLSIELSNNAVIEDNAGQIIGFLSTTDEDIGDSHSYTVSDDRFEVVDDGTGSMVLKLKDGQSIDADTEPTVNLSITSTDSGGMSTQQSFAINVDPVADAPSLSIGNAQTTIIDTNFESFAGDSTSFLPEAEGWQTDSSVEVWQGDTGNYGAASTHIELNTDPRDGYADAPNIYQTVDTVDGATYTLTLDYAGRPGYGADVNTIEVIWDGQVVATISDDASDSSVYNWQTHTINLTGDGDPSKIEIREAGVDVDYGRGMHVDNISMVESITSAAHGEAGEAINLPDIMPTLPDADGSESLALSLGNLPDGTVLSDDTNSVTIGADGESGDIASWDLDNLQATPPADYVGTVNVQVTATTTETSNGDTATTTTSFNMQVEEPHVVNEVTGTTASETLDGTSGDDLISASAGDDTINAYDGSDIVYGGDGNDTIDGGSGNDALYGDNGNDVIVGGGGSDTIYGGGGNDSMSGGDGNDNFFYLLGDGNDTINGGSGSDWTDSIEILAADGTETTEYGTDWTINLTSGTSGMTPDGEQMLLSDDATGTIDFDDGSSITFENIDRIAW
nr:Ig-like domain-containing protein [uncultured Cohaesibacter sp.]